MHERNTETFLLQHGASEERIEGRAEAVARAKSLSAATGERVLLESVDGQVTMQFEKGRLEVFSAESRERGQGRQRDLEDDDEGLDLEEE